MGTESRDLKNIRKDLYDNYVKKRPATPNKYMMDLLAKRDELNQELSRVREELDRCCVHPISLLKYESTTYHDTLGNIRDAWDERIFCTLCKEVIVFVEHKH